MAFITKGIRLIHCGTAQGDKFSDTLPGAIKVTDGVIIPGLQEVSELQAGNVASEYDKIEITTLADARHVYTNGLLGSNEYDSLSFTFLYDPQVYGALVELSRNEASSMNENGLEYYGSKFIVEIPNGSNYSKFTITGLSTVKLNSASVNSALTMVMTITPNAAINFTA